MKVTLLAHTQLSDNLRAELLLAKDESINGASDGQVVSLAAIRQCYSYKTAIEVLETESEKYFGDKGKEGQRLFKQIHSSGHTSTLEHINFTFTIEDVSRALLAQLTRHRQLSFSVQSQRYNKFSSDSRSGGFDYVMPETVKEKRQTGNFEYYIKQIQDFYNEMIENGIPQEDARSVLPNAATCNLVVSGNLRAWLEFYNKRKKGHGAQNEITVLAELIKQEIINVEPFTADFFNYKPKSEVEILKEKKDVPTKIKFGGKEYALVHEDNRQGGYKQSVKDKASKGGK